MPKTLILLLWSAIFAASGCFSADAPSIPIGVPEVGDRFVYEGTDGSRITATIVGTGTRTDGFQQAHDSWLIRYTIRPANFSHIAIGVEEAIDRTSGTHVRHDVLCRLDGPPEALKCDPNLHEIFFVPYGFGGGLGMAPFWGEDLHEGDLDVPFPGGERSSTKATATRVDVDGRSCLKIQPVAEDADLVGPWMPVTAGLSSRTVCEGDVLPTEWVPDRAMPLTYSGTLKPVFHLVEQDKVDTRSQASDSKGPPSPPRDETQGPMAALSQAKPVGGFDAATAHDLAVQQDPGYARFLQSGTPAILVHLQYTSGGGMSAVFGTVKEEQSNWQLLLAHQDGSAYQATVQKTVRSTPTEEETIYEVTESGPASAPVRVPSGAAELTGYDAALAYDYGRALFGFSADGAYHTFDQRERISGSRIPLDDRFISRTFYVSPEDKGPCQGMCIVTPWIVDMESKNGAITYVRLPSDMRLKA